MPVPRYQPHYTFADYAQWQGDWELWNGLPVAMTPSPFGNHQQTLTRLARLLGNELERVGCECEALVELDWVVTDDTVVRPDLMIVCNGVPARHQQTAPALVAEVLSVSTASRDRTFKRALYASQSVPLYLMVEPEEQQIEVLHLAEDRYHPLASAVGPFSLSVHPDCEIILDPSKLFRR